MEKLLTKYELAALASVEFRTIDRWRKGVNGVALRTRQKGGRIAFAESDLEAFYAECERQREEAKRPLSQRTRKTSREAKAVLESFGL